MRIRKCTDTWGVTIAILTGIPYNENVRQYPPPPALNTSSNQIKAPKVPAPHKKQACGLSRLAQLAQCSNPFSFVIKLRHVETKNSLQQ